MLLPGRIFSTFSRSIRKKEENPKKSTTQRFNFPNLFFYANYVPRVFSRRLPPISSFREYKTVTSRSSATSSSLSRKGNFNMFLLYAEKSQHFTKKCTFSDRGFCSWLRGKKGGIFIFSAETPIKHHPIRFFKREARRGDKITRLWKIIGFSKRVGRKGGRDKWWQ